MISFFVLMIPIGKARARTTRRGTYTPQKTVDAERLIAWECKKAMDGLKPLEGPVKLEWRAYFPIPKSWAKKKVESTYWHVSKPDRDNIEKLIADALKGIAWIDDSQVCCGEGRKHYTAPEAPRPGINISFGRVY